MNPTLILLCGLPGSGKTTFARKLADERRIIRLCTDDWQAALEVEHSNEKFHDLLEDQLWIFAQVLLKYGQSVIFEKGLWRRSERDDKRREAEALEVEIEFHYFDIPVEELIRRLETRNKENRVNAFPVDKELIQEYATKYFQPPDIDELNLFVGSTVHTLDGGMPDFDGSEGRSQSILE